MAVKYINPSGFPENLPQAQLLENHFKRLMAHVSESFGYTPLETSAVEYLETIASKGEVNKEIYTIQRALSEGDEDSERALRFDLTVPFARYVAQHYNDLLFPFKRYQIQRVWRGDRPQKGRFREFYQADIDVIANHHLPVHYEAEVLVVMARVLDSFGFGTFTMRINSRSLMQGVLEHFGVTDTQSAIRCIDKFDKVGATAVSEELVSTCGVSPEAVPVLIAFLDHDYPLDECRAALEPFATTPALSAAVQEFCTLAESLVAAFPKDQHVVYSPKIARGLDYYTGMVFETTIDGYEKLGSICSGGRYDDLAGKFIGRKLPGVGASIGLTRLISIIEDNNLLSIQNLSLVDVVVGLKGEEERATANALADTLRAEMHTVETYYDASESLGTQKKFAEKRGAHYFVSQQGDTYTVLDLRTSEEEANLSQEGVIALLAR